MAVHSNADARSEVDEVVHTAKSKNSGDVWQFDAEDAPTEIPPSNAMPPTPSSKLSSAAEAGAASDVNSAAAEAVASSSSTAARNEPGATAEPAGDDASPSPSQRISQGGAAASEAPSASADAPTRKESSAPEEERPRPEAAPIPPMLALALAGDSLDLMMAPGDVLIFRGNGGLLEIGTLHGFMGHTMLVLSAPVSVRRGTPEGRAFESIWPSDGVQELWRVRTLESTREAAGLYEVDCVLYVDRRNGELVVIAEAVQKAPGEEMKLVPTAHESVLLFQSPADLRVHLRVDIMHRVVQEMRRHDSGWSLSTGLRAVLSSAKLSGSSTLKQVKSAWLAEPICTSVVISFWQRYLCHIAAVSGPEERRDERAMQMILKVMPLLSDRGLPRDLIAALESSSWIKVSNLPRVFKPILVQPVQPPPPPPAAAAPAPAPA
mmetsp:Transcript_19277/g.45015  ORF Transcript_19277/g.45015 Transcript_19277/m.45015 type:complete len:435 (-) Transcript_19277:111-1415(-)|eukprot:CAMPEP_0178411554 /NCGR_PEP_ID=MMETSP0689_2-20121128/21552_1 /TAXON_ID=160604 /ORGANISM="Amphidinium massartii, Strain CS-259" /LENGTH=434 /DNA_ID=CAMNT_0020032759 /DNA_START=154 /DNA_END=1458 /DNA_ORIENTATION=-